MCQYLPQELSGRRMGLVVGPRVDCDCETDLCYSIDIAKQPHSSAYSLVVA